jgi:hypothetical protein
MNKVLLMCCFLATLAGCSDHLSFPTKGSDFPAFLEKARLVCANNDSSHEVFVGRYQHSIMCDGSGVILTKIIPPSERTAKNWEDVLHPPSMYVFKINEAVYMVESRSRQYSTTSLVHTNGDILVLVDTNVVPR